jgi:hypothetical protein
MVFTELKGTNLQLHYMMISGSAQVSINYMVISGVKFTRLKNTVKAAASGDGSGTLMCPLTLLLTKRKQMRQATRRHCRGSQITLTAHRIQAAILTTGKMLRGQASALTFSSREWATARGIPAARTYNPVFGAELTPCGKAVDGNTRNTLTGDNLGITHGLILEHTDMGEF